MMAAGAMGEVYLAMDVALSRLVAVKVLKPELAGNPARKKRFLHEAQIAARLRHPNIAEILHYAPAGQSVYIAMELVTGETLAQIVVPARPAAAERGVRARGQGGRSVWRTRSSEASSIVTSSRITLFSIRKRGS